MARTELPDQIETERLVLRVRTVADAEDIHAYASLPEVAYSAGFPRSECKKSAISNFNRCN
ncbi:acetyltransferase [Streptococcus pneumoniae]|nr:acetyltransferase [Streptococcus pneumoniae]